jgi:hypothetical protein
MCLRIHTLCWLFFSLMVQVSAAPRFMQDSITPEEFGIMADKDETAKFTQLINYARANRLFIRLTGGKTYIFSPLSTVDLTGMRGFTGSGTFDLRRTGSAVNNNSMTAVFQVQGTKKLLQTITSGMVQGNSILRIQPGLPIAAGDVLFLTSSEPLANTQRPYYYSGQRLKVAAYSRATGELKIKDTLYFNMRSACLWLNDDQPLFTVGKDLRFITAPMNFITCFRIFYAHANMSGYYQNFALTAIMYKSSEGTVKDMAADLPVTENNGYSHCIQVGDMSDVTIMNCHLTGGRHVVSGIGGGLWKGEECGGKGNAGFPSRMVVDGGVYAGTKNIASIPADIGTVDSHGLIAEMQIRNCTIYGGINLGANQAIIENVKIYTDGKRAFNVGSDVRPGSDWGHYLIRRCVIYAQGANTALLISKADIKELKLEQIKVIGSNSVALMDFRYNSPRLVEVQHVEAPGMTATHLILSRTGGKLNLINPGFSEQRVKRIY